MANEFEWQGPQVRLQDVVLMDFACQSVANGPKLGGPLQCPDPLMPGQSTIEQIWADAPDMMPTVLPVGQWNNQAAWWAGMRSSGGSALATVFRKYALRFPKDSVPGRVAAIGFSQGCQGIKELISGSADADRIDFVYACDGMHGHLDSGGTVTESSIKPWVDFGIRAASGEKMMVVTCSNVIPANRSEGVASTTETADRFVELVRKGLGYKEISPRMIPRGLIGQEGWEPTPPRVDGIQAYWPGWSNAESKSVVTLTWGVERHTIIGNLIVVWFGSNFAEIDARHIFQDWWVKDQVLREVLACRWAAKCSSDLLNPDATTTKSLQISMSGGPALVNSPRFPSVLYAEPSPKVTLGGTAGLGTVASGGACVLEGVFSNLMSAGDMQKARTVSAIKTAAIGVGAVAGGWWLIKKLLERRR